MEYRISDKLSSLKPSAIREIFKSLTDPRIIAFAAGNPAPESFPAKELAKISADIFENESTTALQYGITEGYPRLREQVRERLITKFDSVKDDDMVVITSGGQQAIELACKAMCDEGDVVICEEPTFIGALNAFRSLGAKPVGVPLGEDGLDIDILEQTLKEQPRAKLIYLIPTFHNPAGITTSLEKRRAIYELAKKYGVLILEDNPYGELRFAGEEIPTIKSMDEDGIVIYCGSFSKILSAGMRIGFFSAPEKVAQKMVVAKQVEDVHTNQFFQMVCSRFIDEYGLDEHIERIRALYRRKCGIMLDALDANMNKSVTYTRPQGGLFIMCTLPDILDLNAVVEAALERFVAVVPGTAFSCDPNAESQSFRITYSTPSEEEIVRGVDILSNLLRRY